MRVESDAGVSAGTGVFIGPNAILTAAHVVNNIRFGDDRVPNRTTAFPAYSYLTEGTTPFGSSTARSYIVSSNWADNNNHNYDWAIVILNSNLGDSVGHYGFKWQSASYNGTSIYAHGYPGEINDEENEFLYMTQGTIAKSYEFFYAVMILMQMKE